VCAAFVPSQPGSENKGDLNAKKGSFLAQVVLPQGARVKQLSLFANDNDGDDQVFAFLVRKQIANGLSPQFEGYEVMAQTNSTGAVANTMRQFTTTGIAAKKIDNRNFYYYLEMINCATIEPFDVTVAFDRGYIYP
jgi:hypothetical protein